MPKYVLAMMISLLVFLVSACGQTAASYGIPVPIKHLKWGMDKEETLNALGVTEKEITETTNGFMLKEGQELYNRPAEVYFSFSSVSDQRLLLGITAKFKPEDVAYIEQEITIQRGDGSYQYNAKNEPIQISWSDMELQDNKKWLAVVEKIYNDLGMKTTENPMEDGVNVTFKPITSCALVLDKGSPRYGMVDFNGQAAAMLNYPGRYAPKS